MFSSSSVGRWVGVVLDEPKGKNNGTIKGTKYFTVSLIHILKILADFKLFLVRGELWRVRS